MGQRVLSQVRLPTRSTTVDVASFHVVHEYIGTGTPGATDWAALANACIAFINTAASGASFALAKYIGPTVDFGTNHASVYQYDITGHENGSSHGSPILITNWTVANLGTVGPMPEGVSACISYQSAYGTDVEFGPSSAIPTPPDIIADYGASATHTGRTRPRSRDRNRLYLGPLNTNAFANEATTNRTIFSTAFITDCLAALFALGDISEAGTPTWALRVWSRRDAAVKLVTEAWMDDRPDYQRRRSDPSSLRTFKAMPSA